MTLHLAALTAAADLLTSHPLPPGASISVNLDHHFLGAPGVTFDLHQTPRALTADVVDALDVDVTRSYLADGEGTGYRVTRYRRGDVSVTHYGPRMTPQARRTAARGDVRRAFA